MRLSNSPAFNRAASQSLRLGLAVAFVALILTLLAAPLPDSLLRAAVEPYLPTTTSLTLIASLLLLLAGLSGAVLNTIARDLMVQAELRHEAIHDEVVGTGTHPVTLLRVAWPAGWSSIALMFALSGAAVGASWWSLITSLPLPDVDPGAVPFGVVALIACLPVLVVERHLVLGDVTAFPESLGLALLLRVVLAVLVCMGFGRLAAHAGYGFGLLAPRVAATLTIMVSLELALRTTARCFKPFSAPVLAPVPSSTIAGLLRLSAPTSGGIQRSIRATLGIDVSQSWALGYLRRAILPTALGLASIAWLVTGLAVLPFTERAVYERFGRPAGVLGPGLHFVLPWPVGMLRRVESGVVHDLALGLPGDVAGPVAANADQANDRLWDTTHPGEVAYLIADESDNRQSFGVADVDVRVLWHVGDSDRDTLEVAYGVDDPETVIRGLAGRLLARRLAGSSLEDILVEDRQVFEETIRRELQEDCEALRLGIRIAAVIVEAIHPPLEAAAAYHAVQASEIQARTEIADARGAAIDAHARAATEANATRDAASAASRQTAATARAQEALFATDHAAWQTNAAGFLFERRLTQIVKALADRELVILDHRLSSENVPLLDLRGTTMPLP